MEDEKFGEMTVEEDEDGKAVWVFEGKIKTDVPLETEADTIVEAINELVGKLQDGGGGDVFYVNGSESGITVTMVKNRGEGQELNVEMFTFNTNTYKTTTTLQSGNTAITKTWSKTAISEVLKDGETVWKFTLDAIGTVTAVKDSVGNDVLNGKTGADGNSVITPTPEGIALGWALAYNNEQDSAMQKIIDAYQDGVTDCDEINAAEGVGGGNGDGDGTGGDGTGGDGTGDGEGGGKLPDKSFSYMPIPLLPDDVEIPDGAKAYSVEYNYNGGARYWFAAGIYVTQYSDSGRSASYIAPGVSFTLYDDGTVRDYQYQKVNTATSGNDKNFYGDVIYR